MKIIDLLNKIAKGEVASGTRLKIKDKIYFYLEDKCYFQREDDELYVYTIDLYRLNEEIEILEKVEDKEYEDIDEAEYLEQGEYIDYASDYEVKFDIVKNRRLINALIRNQKYILERLEKGE